MERRLSAILVADMVGYSRLMERNETDTLVRQKAHRSEIIDPTLVMHHGRLVKSTGDGLLAEFPSVVEAVRCAVEVQRAMAVLEADQSQDRRIDYRVGIHLGDVFHEDGDIHGDGVNVAARLEALAEPGGICLSGDAYNQLRGLEDVGFEDMSDVQVKNISRPIRAWRVLLDPEQAGTRTAAPKQELKARSLVAFAAALLLAVAIGGYWWSQQTDFAPADPDKYAFELPEKPSIAVLAFNNVSGDPSNGHIGDGLAEDIIATLSSFPKLFVIAGNSSFQDKGEERPVTAVAEELGVRYVLEGSVQRFDKQIRVTARLVDALGGQLLWANSYDRDLSVDNLFAIQDDISRDVAISLDAELVSGDVALSLFEDAGDLHTYILNRQAIAEFQKFSPEGNQRTEELASEALKRNPDSVIALIHLGYAHLYKIPMGQSQDPAASMATAWEYANKALALDPNYPGTLGLITWLHLAIPNHEAALKSAEKIVQFSPGGGIAASLAGWAYSASGYPERGVELIWFGMRTEPYYPDWVPDRLAVSLMMLDRLDDAKAIFEQQFERADSSARLWAFNGLAAIAVWQDDISAARDFIARAEAERGAPSSIAEVRQWNRQIQGSDYLERYVEALRIAGVPENPSVPPRNGDK